MSIEKMSSQEKKETLQEAKILEALDHPNIIRFREVYKTKKSKLHIVMDYADGGDLGARIKSQRGRNFSEDQILDWFTQICLGMKHIHDRKILHRDIKAQNIFLTKSGMVKIGDLGIARVLSKTNECVKTMVGTPYYLSPEIVQNKPYNFKSDVWALGVLLYELCALKPPFDGTSLHMLGMRITRGNYPALPRSCSVKLQNLVKMMLATSTHKRPSIYQILKQEIVQNRIQSFLSQTVLKDEFSHTIFHKQQLISKDGQINKLEAPSNANSNMPAIEAKKSEDRRPQPVKSFDPQLEKAKVPTNQLYKRPSTGNSTPSNGANNYHYRNKGGNYPVGYNRPATNNVIPKSRPKYAPPSINEDEQKRRREKEKEREEVRRQVDERERKNKEAQKKLEKQRLDQWRKDYEEKQKVEHIQKQKHEQEHKREQERMKQYHQQQMAQQKQVEDVQRSNLYYQARNEAEMNKRRHQEMEKNAQNNIFGGYEPEPVKMNRPSTAAQANADVSGQLNNNQLNKNNYHYKNKSPARDGKLSP